MFSLCITTMNRYNFLSKNLPNYIQNNLIEEIIIQDENGKDVDKIKKSGLDLTKIKLYQNKKKLGPFLNKIEVCKKAKNDWIVLMDSDNYANADYFKVAKDYIEKQNNELIILAPSWAKPNFDYRKLENMIYRKGNFREYRQTKKINECCMNTGNYVLNKKIFSLINLEKETKNISKSSACDVIYFNTLCFEQTNVEMHIVKDLHYNHVVHNDSIYLKTCNIFKDFNKIVYQRFRKLE